MRGGVGGNQLTVIFFQAVQSGSGRVGTRVVMVEKQTTAASVWMACSQRLEDLGQAGVDVLLGVDYLFLLEQDRGHITGFGKEGHDHLFVGSAC